MDETVRVLEGIADVYRVDVELQHNDETQLHDVKAAKIAAMPYVATFFILKPDGHPIASARTFPLDRSLDLFGMAPIHEANDSKDPFVGDGITLRVHDSVGKRSLPVVVKARDAER